MLYNAIVISSTPIYYEPTSQHQHQRANQVQVELTNLQWYPQPQWNREWNPLPHLLLRALQQRVQQVLQRVQQVLQQVLQQVPQQLPKRQT